MKKLCLCLCVLTILLSLLSPALAEIYVDNYGRIPDLNSYPGSREGAYAQILNNHSAAIRQYQSRNIDFIMNDRGYSVPCYPVGQTDLTGDGVPELIFMEAAGGGSRGDLYVYAYSASAAQCVLYVPGVTRLDYDEFLGFDIYLSTAGGGTLVIEHYQYEKPWALQFSWNGWNQFTLASYLTADWDNSGEGNDHCYRSGQEISYAAYESALNALRGGRTRTVSSYFAAGYASYGFDSTLEAALNALNAASNPFAPSASQGVYGLAIQKLATRTGPSTKYAEGGTYEVKGQFIRILAKAYDRVNEIWWVKCEIPYRNEIRVLWTGYKRFDPNTVPLSQLPEEVW